MVWAMRHTRGLHIKPPRCEKTPPRSECYRRALGMQRWCAGRDPPAKKELDKCWPGGGRILEGCVGCPQLFERCGAKKRMKQLKQCAAHGIRFLQVCACGVGVAAGAAYAQEVAPAASWDVTAAGRGIARVSFIGAVPLFQVDWCNTARGDLGALQPTGIRKFTPRLGCLLDTSILCIAACRSGLMRARSTPAVIRSITRRSGCVPTLPFL
ncbi:hypothetical protein TPADAL_0134a [Treponema pallidum subsp. pallidum DAL-1]|nr:hypothetical protein TPADAL_0134a [Treponema pallidum subsp. pallidum DAL-1]AYF91879.1 hypothetical protein CRX41_00735 [Treponema pallidum subsp. pallidum]